MDTLTAFDQRRFGRSPDPGRRLTGEEIRRFVGLAAPSSTSMTLQPARPRGGRLPLDGVMVFDRL